MADFLDLNGISISVLDGSAASPGPIDIGETDRAVDGTLIRSRIALKQQYGWTTAPLDPATAFALKSLINGFGNHWSFDSSIYSGKGLGPSGGSNYQQNNSGGKYGGNLQVGTSAALASFIVNPAGLDAAPAAGGTLMFWGRQQDGVTWKHYAYTTTNGWFINGVTATDTVTACVSFAWPQVTFAQYGSTQNAGIAIPTWVGSNGYTGGTLVQPTIYNGRYYKAGPGGISGSIQPTWPTVLGNTVGDGAGSLFWTDQGPLPLFIDDLVLLPFQVPLAWISSLYTFMSGQAYPDCPLLWASGLYPLNAGNVMGQVGNSQLMQVMLGGTLTQNYQTVEFTLQEA